MKRSHQDSALPGQGTSWSGLSLQPAAEQDKQERSLTSAAKLVDAGLAWPTFLCVLCQYAVETVPTVCTNCDDGRFHIQCFQAHSCPGKAGAVNDLGAPVTEGVRNAGVPADGAPSSAPVATLQSSPVAAPKGEDDDDSDSFPGKDFLAMKFGTADEARVLLAVQGDASAASKLTESEPSKFPLLPSRLRSGEPLVKPYGRGSEAMVRQIEADPDALAQALQEFENDKFTASNVGNANSRQAWSGKKGRGC